MNTSHEVKSYSVSHQSFTHLAKICMVSLAITGQAFAAELSSDKTMPIVEEMATITQQQVDIPTITEPKQLDIPQVSLAVASAVIPQHSDYENPYIPVIANARVFANLTDALPAVVNYFTEASEDEVINFYQQAYGEVLSQERKRGRLTLSYQQGEQKMRVVISSQGDKRQVDVLVEQVQ